jgi:hypothetical protein
LRLRRVQRGQAGFGQKGIEAGYGGIGGFAHAFNLNGSGRLGF